MTKTALGFSRAASWDNSRSAEFQTKTRRPTIPRGPTFAFWFGANWYPLRRKITRTNYVYAFESGGLGNWTVAREHPGARGSHDLRSFQNPAALAGPGISRRVGRLGFQYRLAEQTRLEHCRPT